MMSQEYTKLIIDLKEYNSTWQGYYKKLYKNFEITATEYTDLIDSVVQIIQSLGNIHLDCYRRSDTDNVYLSSRKNIMNSLIIIDDLDIFGIEYFMIILDKIIENSINLEFYEITKRISDLKDYIQKFYDITEYDF